MGNAGGQLRAQHLLSQCLHQQRGWGCAAMCGAGVSPSAQLMGFSWLLGQGLPSGAMHLGSPASELRGLCWGAGSAPSTQSLLSGVSPEGCPSLSPLTHVRGCQCTPQPSQSLQSNCKPVLEPCGKLLGAWGPGLSPSWWEALPLLQHKAPRGVFWDHRAEGSQQCAIGTGSAEKRWRRKSGR